MLMLKLRMRLRCYFFPLLSGTLQTLQKLEETSAKLCESEENHSKQKYQLAALQKAVESLRVKKDQLKRDLQNTPWKVCWPVKDYRYHDFPNTEFSYFLTFDAKQYELSNYLLKNGGHRQGRRQPHSSGWARVPLSSFFPQNFD